MKIKLSWLVVVLVLAVQGAWADGKTSYPPALKPEPYEAQAAHLTAEFLSRYHYKKVPVDNALSGKIFDQYLKVLDPEKLFFTQPDIDRLSSGRNKLGADILKEDLSVAFSMFNLYEHLVADRFDYARALLKKGFDFQQTESYQIARDKAAWAQSESDIQDLWRKRVKNDWLRLKLAGNDNLKSVEVLDKRYANFLKTMGRIKSEDAFQTYMNAYTLAIDPHTNYLGPRAAEDFDVSMRLSLVGIGAVLAEIDTYTTIREVVPGGPAGLSGQLNIGDRIVGVAQGEGGDMADVLGWRLDDVVAKIRGTADSVVRLDVLPADAGADGKHKMVSLTRKKISLAEQSAKSSIESVVQGKLKRRIGVITLPSFYEDFAARQNDVQDYKSATRDVARLLSELKKEKVDGVLIDLRNNGGGSLVEAVELTGLFIDKGPVVQQRNTNGDISVESDTQAGVAWDGPLGVLINRASASASEIFAAAIQDYGRGVIVGEPSFGKGTVQSVINLDEVAKNAKPLLGELKLTIAQFFRINGGTTQLRGVTPDILFPAVFDVQDFGESSFDNALPWAQIKAADYSPAGDLKALLPRLLALHEVRVKNDKDFQYLSQDLSELRLERTKNLISLNEGDRRKERDAKEVRRLSRDAQGDSPKVAQYGGAGKADVFRDDGLQVNERNLAKELAAEKEQKAAKDVFLIEAAHILADEVNVLQTRAIESTSQSVVRRVVSSLIPGVRTSVLDEAIVH